MAGQTFFGSNLRPGRIHVGRNWSGPDWQAPDCPCEKAPCGLTIEFKWHPDCTFHGLTKTIRQTHHEDDCPGA